MKNQYLAEAMQRVSNPELLINLVSRRVRQLNSGHRPLVPVDPKMEPRDVALREIADGKIGFELLSAEAPAEAEKPKE